MRHILSLAGIGLMSLARFLFLVSVITLAGSVSGALLFLLVGLLFRMDFTAGELAVNGFQDGGFLALIWAPGASFIALVIHAKKRKEDSETKSPNRLDSGD